MGGLGRRISLIISVYSTSEIIVSQADRIGTYKIFYHRRTGHEIFGGADVSLPDSRPRRVS